MDVLSIRRSTDSKKAIEKIKRNDSLFGDLPLCTINTISGIDDNVKAEIDKRREEEIKNIKRKWYENNSGRYRKSKKIR